MFWSECEEFKDGVHDNTNVGTVMIQREDETVKDLRKRRAEKMRDKYIMAGSRLEVNIDDGMRDRVRSTCRARMHARASTAVRPSPT